MVHHKSNSQFWLADSAASNHMTNSSSVLKNVREYHGSSQIQVANGGHIPITKVGDITPTFKNIFVSPKLSTSLISVGQLVDVNCDVYFSYNGCLVQDQVSGKVIAKGPKVGRLFLLYFSIPRCLFFACTTVQNKSEVWHKRLGHPNSVVLSRLLNSGLLGNKTQFSHAHYKYFVTFIDDYSRFTWVYFLRSKSKVFYVFKSFFAYIET
jgi:hypothetical protein